jgi:hypothetical protein
MSGSSYALESYELTFHQDLNGDGVIGPTGTVIQTDGSTSLTLEGNSYGLNGSSGSGPILQYAGAPVTVGEYGGWAPLGAVQTANGYDVAWKETGVDAYLVWMTGSNGNFVSETGVMSGSSFALESYESTFHQDLNGDGVIGPLVTAGGTLELPSAYNGPVTFAGSTGTLQLDDSVGFSGTVAGMSGQDVVDLRDINFSTIHTPVYSGTSSGGVLTVTDGVHVAQIDLIGNYLASSFAPSSDGQGGTDIIDPPSGASSTGTSVNSTATGDDVSGTISFADVDHANALTVDFAPNSTDDAGTFSIGAVSANGGQVSLGFNFSLDNDQINLAQGRALTQSYSVSLVESQNPAANLEQTISLSIGGPGNDNFVFHPGIGAETIVNFNPQQDTIELDNFASAETVQQLQSLIHTDAHNDAVIDLGHGDSVTLAGTTPAQLLAVLQNAVHLH